MNKGVLWVCTTWSWCSGRAGGIRGGLNCPGSPPGPAVTQGQSPPACPAQPDGATPGRAQAGPTPSPHPALMAGSPPPSGKQSRGREREMRIYCRNGVRSRAQPSRGSAATHREHGPFLPAPGIPQLPLTSPGRGDPASPPARAHPQPSLPAQFPPVWQSTSSHPSSDKALPHLSPKKAAPTPSIAQQLHAGDTRRPSRGAGAAVPSQHHQNSSGFPPLPPQWQHQLQGPAD